MRLLALVAVASLALATPGCTFIGAGIGAAIPVTKDDLNDPVQTHHDSRGTHALLGAGIGLLVDIIVVSLATSLFENAWDFGPYGPSDNSLRRAGSR